jgi:hypothetical protein
MTLKYGVFHRHVSARLAVARAKLKSMRLDSSAQTLRFMTTYVLECERSV